MQSTEEKNYLAFLHVVFQNARKNPYHAKLIILLVLIMGMYRSLEEFYPFLFHDLGFSEGMIGFMHGVNFVFVILGSVLVGYISKYARNWEVLLSLTAGFFILLLALGKNPISLLGLYFAAMLLTIFEIRLINKIQLQIASHERATVLSKNSFLTGGWGLVLFLWYGHLTNTSGIFSTVFFTGTSIVVVSIISLIFFLFKERKSLRIYQTTLHEFCKQSLQSENVPCILGFLMERIPNTVPESVGSDGSTNIGPGGKEIAFGDDVEMPQIEYGYQGTFHSGIFARVSSENHGSSTVRG